MMTLDDLAAEIHAVREEQRQISERLVRLVELFVAFNGGAVQVQAINERIDALEARVRTLEHGNDDAA